MGIVKYLIEQGVNVNKENKYRETALIEAASGGHLEVLKYLVEHGADIEKYVDTALYLAENRRDIVIYLAEKKVEVKNFKIRIEKDEEDIGKIRNIISELLKQDKDLVIDIAKKHIKMDVIHTKEGYLIQVQKYTDAIDIQYVSYSCTQNENGYQFKSKNSLEFMDIGGFAKMWDHGVVILMVPGVIVLTVIGLMLYEVYRTVKDKYRDVVMKKCDYREKKSDKMESNNIEPIDNNGLTANKELIDNKYSMASTSLVLERASNSRDTQRGGHLEMGGN